jgi:ABC-type glutathione transport system ATPase component
MTSANKSLRPETPDPLIRATNLSKQYSLRTSAGLTRKSVFAFENVDLTVGRGVHLAIIGESGAGKSTLARCLALLEEPSSGEIWFEGLDVLKVRSKERRSLHAKIQIIFQDPASSFNPQMSAAEIVEEPLLVQEIGTSPQRRLYALEMMDQVGLSSAWERKRALEFSGGQRQRLAIARALVLKPEVLILDEALSGLDPFNQRSILQLLAELQDSFQLACVHISHDLRMVAGFADEVAVMHAGRIVEHQRANEFFVHPEHRYSAELVEAILSTESILLGREG